MENMRKLFGIITSYLSYLFLLKTCIILVAKKQEDASLRNAVIS